MSDIDVSAFEVKAEDRIARALERIADALESESLAKQIARSILDEPFDARDKKGEGDGVGR